MTIEEFKIIIDKPESTILDFKNEEYDFSRTANEAKQSEFIKDIISFTNTIRNETAYIIIGINELENGQKELNGISKITDDSILQQKIKSKTIPHPIFSYSSIQFEGKVFGIIEIPISKYDFPIMTTIKLKGIEPGKIYFRRGSSNSEANGIESINIVDWFRNLPMVEEKTNNSLHQKISEIITKLTTKNYLLSSIITECLSIAKKNSLKKLETFCHNELTGWKKSGRKNWQFRNNKVLITPLKIDIPNFSNLTSTQILKQLAEIDGVFEYNIYFKQPIIEIEEAISKLTENKYSLMTMQTDGKTFFNDEKKSQVTMTYYISAQNFINIHNSVRQKLIDLLLEV